MTELENLRRCDGILHARFLAAGMASIGFYTAPGANFDVRVRVIVDRGVQVLGEFGQVAARRDEMQLLLEDVPEPKTKGQIFIEGQEGSGVGEKWQLVEKISEDGSLSRWAVRRVAA